MLADVAGALVVVVVVPSGEVEEAGREVDDLLVGGAVMGCSVEQDANSAPATIVPTTAPASRRPGARSRPLDQFLWTCPTSTSPLPGRPRPRSCISKPTIQPRATRAIGGIHHTNAINRRATDLFARFVLALHETNAPVTWGA